jgi:hypothetical protein
LLSDLEWTIDGERRLRPKNAGKGVMVSAFTSEQTARGFGIRVSEDEWRDKIKPIYDKYHQQHDWFVLPTPLPGQQQQIGIVMFDYGSRLTKSDASNDDALTSGWWNNAKMTVQCSFMLESFDALYGDTHQLLVQIDRSSGHMSRGDNALSAATTNFSDGGMVKGEPAQGFKETIVHSSDFGRYLRDRVEGMIDKANPVQYGSYPTSDDPTRYDNLGPRYDRDTNQAEAVLPPDWRRGVAIAVEHRKNVPPFEFTPPASAKAGDTVTVNLEVPGEEWWRGMKKGKAQLLFETGHINPTLDTPAQEWINSYGPKYVPSVEEQKTKTQKGTDKKPAKKVAELWLAARHDFVNQPTVLERLFREKGHIVVASPRYHPELAGLGIEYCWGKGKWCFRRQINDMNSTNLEKNVMIALGDQEFKMHGSGDVCAAPLPVARVRKFARRARTFRRLFNRFPSHDEAKGALDKWKKGQKVEIEGVAIGAAGEDDSFPDMINKMYTTVKTHRNIIDLDWRFCVDGTEFVA